MKKNLLYVVPILILIILIVLGYYFSSPLYLATVYFEAYSNKDCVGIYNLTEKYSSDFTSLDYFKKVCEKKLKTLKDYTIKVNKGYAVAKSDDARVTMYYKKTGNRKFLIFSEYVVKNHLVDVINDVTLMVPVDSKSVKIDNISIDNYYVGIDEIGIYDIYTIPEMLDTSYTIKATYYYDDKVLEKSITPSLENKSFSMEFVNNPILLHIVTKDSCRFCADALNYLDSLKEDYGNYFTYKKYEIFAII